MAKVAEDEVEYESDPEEEKRLLGMRRRKAASDDEDEEGEGEEKQRMDRRAPIHSDESDGQGGAADYEDEEDEDELEGDEDYEEEAYEDEEAYVDGREEIDGYREGKRGTGERVGANVGDGSEIGGVAVTEEMEGRKLEEGVEVKAAGDREEDEVGEEKEEEGEGEEEGEEGEGKKENEPFAVPTAGAFYMHDDRFRDNAGGRHRRTYGGRKLWESKDDKKWGHDKYEELSMHERHYEQGRRTSRGNFRARGGKSRGTDGGYIRRNRTKEFSNGNNQSLPLKSMRGRGPRKYEPVAKNNRQTSFTQNRQSGKPLEKTSHGSSGRVPKASSNTESDQIPPTRKNSSLSSASPPFYPSGSSNKDITLNQKTDGQAGSTSRDVHTPVVDETFRVQQANSLLRGKNIADSAGIDKLYIDDSVNPASGKPINNMQMPPSGSSLVNNMQFSQYRVQGRGVGISGQMTYQASSSHNIGSRGSPTTQVHAAGQRNHSQGRGQPPVQATGQQISQRSGNGSQASSPPKKALSISSYDSGESEANSESSKSRNALVGKGKASLQGSGRGSFLYGGAQVIGAAGNMGVSHGDQNFPGTPTFLPVMQFGGQHPGGMGVPAVGMAFPGYVANPQLGLGNSEMTWLPVLAGAAGALGATYCPPYITVDGAYHTRPSGQTASLGSSSKENSTINANNDTKPSQKPSSEVASDEYGQRQKPRRYSEMDFKQPSTST